MTNQQTSISIDNTVRQKVLDFTASVYDGDGNFLVKPASFYHQTDSIILRIFATVAGIYQFLTTELIDWLRNEIEGFKTIEICAGLGLIGRPLGIVMTDSHIQQTEEFQNKLRENIPGIRGHAMTKPPKDVKKYEAFEAVHTFMPRCVVGAFVTQYTTANETTILGIPGSPFGPKEWDIVKRVQKYIMIGHAGVHARKEIFSLPHKEYLFPWLVNRCEDQSLNRIWVWENSK